MDADRLRTDLLTLPHASETMQWGGRLVFWVGDKAIGGKMFAILNLDVDRHRVIAFPAGPLAFHDLLELDGITPAPYLARIHWVAAERWDVFRPSEWQAHLRYAHQLILDKLHPKTRAVLALPIREQNRILTDRRRVLAGRRKTLAGPSPLTQP